MDRGDELLLPALGLPGSAARALRRAARLRPAGVPVNEAKSFIAGGLQDFSISRAGQPWGIPIPWDPDQVAYVWADALVNYLSALTYARPGEDLAPTFWPAVRHLLAKDILRFHCVYWPAMLLAAGYDVPQQLFVHGYLLLDDRKISKSLGNVARPARPDRRLRRRRRALLVRARGLVRAGRHASIAGLHERYERELGNDLGNLLSRTTAMIARYRDGALAAVARATRRSRRVLEPLGADVAARLDAFDLTGALERDLGGRPRAQPARRGDGAVAAREGRGARRASSTAVLYDLADGLRVVAVALAAYLPGDGAADPRRARPAAGARLGPGRLRPARAPVDGIEAAPPLFPRVDAPADGGVTDTPCAPRRAARSRRRGARRARARGGRRHGSLTVGTGIESCRRALAHRRGERRRVAALGIHPHQAATADVGALDELRELLAHPRRSRSARPASTTSATTRRAARSGRCFDAQLALADDAGMPVVIHTRAADDDTRAALERFDGTGDPPLLLVAALLDGGARARVLRLVCGQRHLPEGVDSARGRAARARRPPARRDRQPVPRAAAASAAGRTSRRTSCTPLAALAEARGADAGRLEAHDRRERDARAFGARREPGSIRRRSISASTSWSTRTSSA